MAQKDQMSEATQEWLAYKHAEQRQTWLERAMDDEQLYFSIQWTDEERSEMLQRGFWPAVQNEILGPARQIRSELSSQAPRFRVLTPSGENVDAETVISGIVRHVEYISNRRVQTSRCAHQAVTSGGIAYKVLERDDEAADGAGELFSRWISNRYVYLPPTCSDIPSLSDADSIIIAKPEPLEAAKRRNPGLSKQLEASSQFHWLKEYSEYVGESGVGVTTGIDEEAPGREFGFKAAVKIQRYTLEKRKRWRITDQQTGLSYVTYDENASLMDRVKEFYGRLEREKLPDAVRCKILHGYAPDIYVGTEWLELDRYPITAYVVEDSGNPFPVDLTWFVKDQQFLLNKFRSAQIQYLQSSIGGKVFLSKDMDDLDKKEIKEKFSRVNSVMEIEFGPSGEKMFEVVQPVAIPPALLTETARGASNIQRGYGVYGLTMGDPSQSHRTNAGMLSLRQFNMQSRRTMLDMWNEAEQDHYDKMVRLIPSVYQVDRTISFLDEDAVPVSLQLNKQEWAGRAYAKVTRVVKDGEETKVAGDLGAMQAMIRLSPDSFLSDGTDRTAMMQLFAELNQLIGGHPALMKQIIRFTDLPNRRDLLAEIDMLPKLQQQNEQYQQLIENLVDQLEDAQGKEAQLQFNQIKQEFQTKEAIDFQKKRADREIALSEDELERERQMLMQEFEHKEEMLILDLMRRRLQGASTNGSS